jgi:hypothetical protein
MALCTYVHEHRRWWSTLLTGGAAGAMREEFMRLSRQIAKVEGRPDAWPPSEIATRLVVSSTIELLSWWLQHKDPLSIQQVADILCETIIKPSITRKRAVAGPASPRSKRAR